MHAGTTFTFAENLINLAALIEYLYIHHGVGTLEHYLYIKYVL